MADQIFRLAEAVFKDVVREQDGKITDALVDLLLIGIVDQAKKYHREVLAVKFALWQRLAQGFVDNENYTPEMLARAMWIQFAPQDEIDKELGSDNPAEAGVDVQAS
jgi:hypothetical protein